MEARPGGEFDRLLETAFDVSHGQLGLAGELARLMRDQQVMVSFVPDAVQERLLSSLSSAAPRGAAA